MIAFIGNRINTKNLYPFLEIVSRSDVCDESRRIKHFKSNNLQFIKSFGYELNNLIR